MRRAWGKKSENIRLSDEVSFSLSADAILEKKEERTEEASRRGQPNYDARWRSEVDLVC